MSAPLSKYATFPLFITAERSTPVSSHIPLFIRTGSTPTISGLYHSLALFVDATSGNVVQTHFPLFVNAGPRGSGHSTFSLFVQGDFHQTDQRLTLFVKNTQTTLSQLTPLYIAGLGTTDWAMPYSGSFPLFIKRGPSASLPLFIQGPGTPTQQSMTLFVGGANVASSGLPLVIPRVSVRTSGVLPMTIAGW